MICIEITLTVIERAMQRRKRDKNLPVAPTDIHFPIPDDLTHIVLRDTGIDDDRRILTLGHADFLPILESHLLFGDGTFDVVPDLFFQTWGKSGHFGAKAVNRQMSFQI